MNTMCGRIRAVRVRALTLNRNDLAGKTGMTNEADTWFNGYQKIWSRRFGSGSATSSSGITFGPIAVA
jgi:membrane peptidoglycan carboxypeptidase